MHRTLANGQAAESTIDQELTQILAEQAELQLTVQRLLTLLERQGHLAKDELAFVQGGPTARFTSARRGTERACFTTDQAAEYTGRHPDTIRRALETGKLHGAQRVPKGRWNIRRECVDAWVDNEACVHRRP